MVASGGEEECENIGAVGRGFAGRTAVDRDAIVSAFHDDTDFGGVRYLVGGGVGADGAKETGEVGAKICGDHSDRTAGAIFAGEGKMRLGEELGEGDFVQDGGCGRGEGKIGNHFWIAISFRMVGYLGILRK